MKTQQQIDKDIKLKQIAVFIVLIGIAIIIALEVIFNKG